MHYVRKTYYSLAHFTYKHTEIITCITIGVTFIIFVKTYNTSNAYKRHDDGNNYDNTELQNNPSIFRFIICFFSNEELLNSGFYCTIAWYIGKKEDALLVKKFSFIVI